MKRPLSIIRTSLLLAALLFFSVAMAQTQQRIVIKTNAVTAVTATTATVHYLVKAEEITVSSHGVCFSKMPDPTISDSTAGPNNKKSIYVGDMADLSGLAPRTRYYVRAWAVTPAGTVYGQSISFKTKRQKKN